MADAAYGAAPMLNCLVEEKGIAPHIPVFDCLFSLAHFKSILNIRCPRLISGGSYILPSDRPFVPLQSPPWPSTSPSGQEKVFEGLP